ncbi:DUF6998 domain-containing protein [Mariniluteicoccus flavus]
MRNQPPPESCGFTAPDVRTWSLADLVSVRRTIDAELARRGYVRTAGSLEGELMERVVADAYGGELAAPGTKSVDVLLADGRGIQVKTRSLPQGDLRFWAFSDLEFDLAVVINMSRENGEIAWARELTADEVSAIAHARTGGDYRLRMGVARDRGLDVTARLSRSFHRLA